MPPHGTEPISLICVGLEKEKKKTALKTLFLLSICHDESPLFRSLLLRLTCLCLFLTCCLPQRVCACPQLVCVCAGRALPHGTALESTVPRLQCQCLEEDQIYSVSASLFLWRLESQPENSLWKTPWFAGGGQVRWNIWGPCNGSSRAERPGRPPGTLARVCVPPCVASLPGKWSNSRVFTLTTVNC